MPYAITFFFCIFSLKHLMHCIILILAHLSARPCPCRAEIESSSGASPKAYGDPQATSCVDTNLALDQGKPRCI
jgi:hypothetical protein